MAVHHVEHVMGTTISIDLVDSHDMGLVRRLVDWFHHVDHVFSPFDAGSPISRIGRGEGVPAELAALLTDEVVEVLQRCEELLIETDGVFDVWNLPSPNGTRFDPCGYVKGWSVQRAAQLLVADGVHDYCLNAGGDVALGGRNRNGDPWRIGVRHPHLPGALAVVLQGEGPLAIATSGTYERGAHIVDPRTGEVCTDIASATVVGTDLADADAYATAAFAMGVGGLEWLSERRGFEGCMITHDLQLLATPGFAAHLAGESVA